MILKGSIIEVKNLQKAHKDGMFELFSSYFDNITRETFEKDLQEKEWVILLNDPTTLKIQGFSTQMVLDADIEGIKVKAIFSGDTIIDKAFWGKMELGRIWFRLVFSIMEKYKGCKLYWFLLTMGYKTYRFLPVYFNEFFPRYDKKTPPFEKKIIDTFAFLKYPKEYNPQTGIIQFPYPTSYLKKGVSEIESHRLNDPHIRFFIEKNKQFEKGDELCCIAELSQTNLKKTAFKIIRNEI